MSTDSRKALQLFFGYDAFLDNQESIIDDILAGNDLCVIMPTGAGKSLCYQLPALMRHSFTVVVSPLISLMKDQVTSPLKNGVYYTSFTIVSRYFCSFSLIFT